MTDKPADLSESQLVHSITQRGTDVRYHRQIRHHIGVMPVKDMDTLQISSCEPKQVLISNELCEPTNFRNNSHSIRLLEDLQSLRKNEVLCDIRFETDDGCVTFGHKNVLMAASPYFRAMFNSRKIAKSVNNTVNIKKLDSTVLELLLDYIYTGEIMITKENVQDLLPSANILQLDFVKNACSEFLQKQLDVSNCLGINAFAGLHKCADLLSTSEAFIKNQFLEVANSDGFLSLSSEGVVKIISCNDLAVPFEEKVYECVIKWVKHNLDQRKDFLPELMEHVRLPLLRPDILNNVVEEPLLNNSPICTNYITEALRFNLKKSVQKFTIPKTIRCKTRQFGGSQKVILMFNRSDTWPKCSTEWYDPATKLRENGPGLDFSRETAGFGVISDQFVFAVGGENLSSSKSVSMLDVSSQSISWVKMVDMLVSRNRLGVGVLGDSIYAIGGLDDTTTLNSVEVFDVSIQKWRMVSSMRIPRYNLGVGVLNNCLYAIGGRNNSLRFNTVECYDPGLDIWTPVANMSQHRYGASVGVLNGVIYAIGGYSDQYLKSVEVYRPSDGAWSFVAAMHFSRRNPGVVTLDGLLYVIGGESDEPINDTVEIYNPITNTWTMETLSKRGVQIYGGVVVDRPPHFTTN